MTGFWTWFLRAAAVIALAMMVVFTLGLAAPGLHRSLTAILDEFRGDRGRSGLIYVESPEVYTRQRLVNDRYLQDAWLRGKLDEIEDDATVWIDTVRVSDDSTVIDLRGAGEGGAAAGDLDLSLAEAAQAALSFSSEFDLQSNARDTIRQMILENALDDRHDLSGNTVFGLKFDTAVMPGSRAELSPTVIVQMQANPLENLDLPAASYAAYYNSSGWADTATIAAATGMRPADLEDDLALLRMIDGHFAGWSGNLEERLNQERSVIAEADPEIEPRACVRPRNVNDRLLERTLCDLAPPVGAELLGRVQPEAETALDWLTGQRSAIDGALDFVLRLPERKITIGTDLHEGLVTDARNYCANAGFASALFLDGLALDAFKPDWFDGDDDAFMTALEGTTLRDFLGPDRFDGYPPSLWFDLPAPWAPLFQFQLDWRIPEAPESCGVEIDIRLNPRELAILFVPEIPDAGERTRYEQRLFGAGLTPLSCTAPACDEDGFSVWIPQDEQAAAVALDDATFEALLSGIAAADVTDRLCVGDGYYYQPGPDDAAGRDEICQPGLLATFRVGAYHFLRKMTGVESYTYAAFPRGDVSGVVSETGSRSGVGGNVSGGGIGGAFGLSVGSRERSAEPEPSLINFAAGDQHELFDFGWSIVKPGVKQPMVASQLVLVSVPAYLDRVELRILKGFLDVDRMPEDWAQRRLDYARHRDGADLTEEQRQGLLEERVMGLFSGYEERRITLKVPPDYGALDGIVIGNNVIGGPRVSTAKLLRCYELGADGQLALAIAGERLWRSTVVTLDGHKASKIEVMPDMRGILASFEELEPTIVGDEVQLVVWTSEGHDSQRITVQETCEAP